ncbi:VOC family protein [Streptomyces sp. N2-109]|uniref:VOC family protein n=1 Tax=Streptomyces gossypii TaxID=2883101 RepID=A0ABT2JPR4_9ACTN|nr:VOC family protein [Streptomyces gossypii]MCT2589860.1 VOC family protein [Streptomyces gossypii]
MNTTPSNTTPSNTAASSATGSEATAEAPAPTVWPTLQAQDAPALIDFLTGTVGFLRTAVYRDGDRVAHAELSWPEGGGVMLGSYQPDAEWSRPPGSFGAYVVTEHVDALYDRLRAAGATVTREITDQDYGSREFVIKDPEGNMWAFGTYRGAPRA